MKFQTVERDRIINGVEVDAYLAVGLRGIFWAPDMSGATPLRLPKFLINLLAL